MKSSADCALTLQPDLIIPATALEHGLTLVTRNVKDFAARKLISDRLPIVSRHDSLHELVK